MEQSAGNLASPSPSPSHLKILASDSTSSTSTSSDTSASTSPAIVHVPSTDSVVTLKVKAAVEPVSVHVPPGSSGGSGEPSQINPTLVKQINDPGTTPSISSVSSRIMPGSGGGAEVQTTLKQATSNFRLSLDPPSKDARMSLDPNTGARMSIDKAHSELQRSMAEVRPFITQGVDTREGGSKYSHCVQMHRLQEELQIPGFDVPRSIGMPSPVVMKFLEKHAPEALMNWNGLCSLYKQESNAGASFLQREDVKQKIQEIETSIIKAFKKAAEKPEIYRELALPQSLETMIAGLQRSGDYLMVRSTGAEDELGASNAGGNKSVAYVSPTHKEVMQAMGIVVASYFSENSLKNRLDSGKNPFNEPLQLAVLTQPLIGEPVLEKATDGPETNPRRIPSSFVCFSCEPIWVGKEKFRVMRISSTFGHGEGVVGEKGIPTDSWTVMRSETNPNRLYIISKIRNKTTRLAPVKSEDGSRPHLEKVKNPKEIAKMPSLSQEQVYKIFENAMIEEAFFNEGALDIEGVCKAGVEAGATTTHFVQARPVTQQPVQAEYFDTSTLNKQQQEALGPSMQLESIDLPGRCNVPQITNRDQLLIAETLEDAAKLYDPKKHLLVIVRQRQLFPEITHAYVIFRDKSVPCLSVEPKNMSELTKMITSISPERPLMVCTQTSQLYRWDCRKADPKACIKSDFGKHPAKITPSPLSRSLHLGEPQGVPEDIRELLLRLRHPEIAVARLALKELEEHPRIKEIQQARQRYAQHADHPKVNKIVTALGEYDSAVQEAFAQTKRVFFSEQLQEQNRLQRLFYAEVLEGTLLESRQDTGVVGRSSVMRVERMSKSLDLLARYFTSYQEKLDKTQKLDPTKKLNPTSHFADLLMDVTKSPDVDVTKIPNEDPDKDPELFKKWQTFLLDLEVAASRGKILPDRINQFKDMMKAMRKSGSLPMWFTFFFKYSPQQDSSEANAVSMFDSLLLQYASDAKTSLLPKLKSMNSQINDLSEQQDRFARPSSFDPAWNELKKVVDVWLSENTYVDIKSASPLVQDIAYQTMERLVATFDTAIKTMKMSHEFTEADKIQRFKRMLILYSKLLKVWSRNMRGKSYDGQYTYIRKMLKSKLENGFRELEPSAGYSLTSFLLNTKESPPDSLEDLFTATHQIFLRNLSFSPQSWETANLPASFKQALNGITRAFSHIGLQITEDEIIYRGSQSLNISHGVQIELVYKKATQQITLDVHFAGSGQEVLRWSNITEKVCILDDLGVIQRLGSIRQNGFGVSFSWKVDVDKLPSLNAHLFGLNVGTYQDDSSSNSNYDPDMMEMRNKIMIEPFMEALRNSGVSEERMLEYVFTHSGRGGSIVEAIFKKSWGDVEGRAKLDPHLILAGARARGHTGMYEYLLNKPGEFQEMNEFMRKGFENPTPELVPLFQLICTDKKRLDAMDPALILSLAEKLSMESLAEKLSSSMEDAGRDVARQMCTYLLNKVRANREAGKGDYPIAEKEIEKVLLSQLNVLSEVGQNDVFNILYGRLTLKDIHIPVPSKEELTSDDIVTRAKARRNVLFLQMTMYDVMNAAKKNNNVQDLLKVFPLEKIKDLMAALGDLKKWNIFQIDMLSFLLDSGKISKEECTELIAKHLKDSSPITDLRGTVDLIYRVVLQDDVRNAEHLIMLAEKLIIHKEENLAKRICNKILELDTRDEMILYKIAKIFLSSKGTCDTLLVRKICQKILDVIELCKDLEEDPKVSKRKVNKLISKVEQFEGSAGNKVSEVS